MHMFGSRGRELAASTRPTCVGHCPSPLLGEGSTVRRRRRRRREIDQTSGGPKQRDCPDNPLLKHWNRVCWVAVYVYTLHASCFFDGPLNSLRLERVLPRTIRIHPEPRTVADNQISALGYTATVFSGKMHKALMFWPPATILYGLHVQRQWLYPWRARQSKKQARHNFSIQA